MFKHNKNELVSINRFKMIILSVIYSIILTLILLFIYAILLSYTNIPESTMELTIIFISVLSILTFSIICMLKVRSQGILNGGIIGLIYMGTIYVLSSIVQTGFYLNIYTLSMVLFGILCGMLGGIIGVNIK